MEIATRLPEDLQRKIYWYVFEPHPCAVMIRDAHKQDGGWHKFEIRSWVKGRSCYTWVENIMVIIMDDEEDTDGI